MYFKLTYSVDTRIIGNVNSQTEDAIFPQIPEGQLFSRDIFLKKVDDPLAVLTPTAILTKKAKLTDVIGGASSAIVGQMIISNRLKQILERITDGKVQFFPLSVIDKEFTHTSYWLICAYDTDMEFINYAQSRIELVGLGSQKIKDVLIQDYQHFDSLIKEIKLPERLSITKVSLIDKCNKDLLVLSWIEGGIGFYVSKKIKSEIEDAQCIGVEFIPI